jgi:putative transposase
VVLLRQIEVLMSQGKAAPIACREAGISRQSCYRWRKEYGGLEVDQARWMKELERENDRLKRLVADLSLEKQVFKRRCLGKLVSPERRRQLCRAFGRSTVSRNVTPAGSWANHAGRNDTPPSSGLMKMR